MSNLNVILSSGYQQYFNFTTGFESTSNIMGTTLEDLGISGYRYNVFFCRPMRPPVCR